MASALYQHTQGWLKGNVRWWEVQDCNPQEQLQDIPSRLSWLTRQLHAVIAQLNALQVYC